MLGRITRIYFSRNGEKNLICYELEPISLEVSTLNIVREYRYYFPRLPAVDHQRGPGKTDAIFVVPLRISRRYSDGMTNSRLESQNALSAQLARISDQILSLRKYFIYFQTLLFTLIPLRERIAEHFQTISKFTLPRPLPIPKLDILFQTLRIRHGTRHLDRMRKCFSATHHKPRDTGLFGVRCGLHPGAWSCRIV